MTQEFEEIATGQQSGDPNENLPKKNLEKSHQS